MQKKNYTQRLYKRTANTELGAQTDERQMRCERHRNGEENKPTKDEEEGNAPEDQVVEDVSQNIALGSEKEGHDSVAEVELAVK